MLIIFISVIYTFYKFKKGDPGETTIKYIIDRININDKK